MARRFSLRTLIILSGVVIVIVFTYLFLNIYFKEDDYQQVRQRIQRDLDDLYSVPAVKQLRLVKPLVKDQNTHYDHYSVSALKQLRLEKPLVKDQNTHYPTQLQHLEEQVIPENCDTIRSRPHLFWTRKVVTYVKPHIGKDCDRLRGGSKSEFRQVKEALRNWTIQEPNLKDSLNNCSIIQEDFLHNYYVSKEELEFPLAFTLVVSSRPFQVLRLLKSIYRPHNFYCIHPDGKMGKDFLQHFKMLERCLSNVFVPKTIYNVYYAHHTLMDAELSCMGELLERYPPPRWKYSINICGTEIPLKTNREMVSSLKRLNGKCAVAVYTTITGGYFFNERLTWELALNLTSERVYHTGVRLSSPPHGLQIYKGDHFVMLTPEFVKFILTDTRAIALRNWLKKVYAPEEEFFSTLYMLEDAPGGRSRGSLVPKVAECVWMFPGYPKRECKGANVRGVCVLSAGDLQLVHSLGVDSSRPVFFFNKYYHSMDHVVMDCMEELLIKHNQQEYLKDCY